MHRRRKRVGRGCVASVVKQCAPAVLHRITSHHIASHHTTPHHTTAHHITAHHITSHHGTSHRITSHHIAAQHITSHHIVVTCTLAFVKSSAISAEVRLSNS